jgi:hypothetical protein
MKKIVEEWKTVEGFPDYEISNMGRCRKKTYNRIKKIYARNIKGRMVYTHTLVRNEESSQFTVGKLVAIHFVPNPNGYKTIIYKDGNSGNFNYLNIEWTESHIKNPYRFTHRIIPRSEQMDNYREFQREIEQVIKYIEEDKIREYVNDIALPAVKEYAKSVVKSYKFRIIRTEMDEFSTYVAESLYDMLYRGARICGIKYMTNILAKAYVRQKYGRPRTVEFNEQYMKPEYPWI